MVIVIDGYNVLKRRYADRFIDDLVRDQFLRQLQLYCQRRHNGVVVVFDGGQSPWPRQERHNGVTVVFVGQSMTADDYIKEYIRAFACNDLLLVSSDHELCAWASKLSIVSLDSEPFFDLLMEETMQECDGQPRTRKSTATKMTDTRDPILDMLMEQSVVVGLEKALLPPSSLQGNSKKETQSKHKRIMTKKVKKL